MEINKILLYKKAKETKIKQSQPLFSPINLPNKLNVQQQSPLNQKMNVPIILDKTKLTCPILNRTNLMNSSTKSIVNKKANSNQPFCKYCNIELLDSMNVLQNRATILLEQPVDQNSLTKTGLISLVSILLKFVN